MNVKIEKNKLSGRDIAILQLVAEGHSNEEIGSKLGLSEEYAGQILQKHIYPLLGIPKSIAAHCKRSRAVYEAMKKGLLQ